MKELSPEARYLESYFVSKSPSFPNAFIGNPGETGTGPSIKDCLCLYPPPDEQRRITAQLRRESAKMDALIAKIREGIEKLKEYRTALISAAVTGKIDVREDVVA